MQPFFCGTHAFAHYCLTPGDSRQMHRLGIALGRIWYSVTRLPEGPALREPVGLDQGLSVSSQSQPDSFSLQNLKQTEDLWCYPCGSQ